MAPTNQVSLACVKCGRPASKEHHQPPDRSSKGMGGTSDPDVESWRVPLCRDCHNSLHKKEWLLRFENGVATGLTPERTFLFVRVIEPIDLCLSMTSQPDEIVARRERLFYASDENLAYYIGLSLLSAKTNILNIGVAADIYRERYAYIGDQWYSKLAEYVTRTNQDGQTISPRELYRCHAIYLAFKDRPDLLGTMPKSLAAAIAEADNPEEALAFCHVAKTRPTVKEIRARFGHHAPVEVEMCTCPECGDTHVRKGAS